MAKSGLKENAPLTTLRHILAVTLAAAILVLFLAIIAVGGALRAGPAPWPGIAVVVMATTMFVVSQPHDIKTRDCGDKHRFRCCGSVGLSKLSSIQGGAFARAVGAKQAKDFTLAHCK
jgi:hypothetical protein